MKFRRSCISPKEECVSTIQWRSVNTRTNEFQQFYEQSQSNNGMDVWISNKQFQTHRLQEKLENLFLLCCEILQKLVLFLLMLMLVFIKTVLHNTLL